MRAMALAFALALTGAFSPVPPTASGASAGDADAAPFVSSAGAPLVVDLKLSEYGRFRRDGSAVVVGTITCSRKAEFAWVEVMLRQRAGRRFVFGWGYRELVPCRRGENELKIHVAEADGVFRGGRAKVQAYAFACRPDDCVEEVAERVIRLKGRAG